MEEPRHGEAARGNRGGPRIDEEGHVVGVDKEPACPLAVAFRAARDLYDRFTGRAFGYCGGGQGRDRVQPVLVEACDFTRQRRPAQPLRPRPPATGTESGKGRMWDA